ncbi:MAG: amidase [Pseudomonadota bacterium]
MNRELWQLSAVELAEGIRNKQFSCVEIMQSVTAHVQRLNPRLNAIVYDYSDEAMAAAKSADEAIASNAEIGPLHGIPVTIKENIDQTGKPTPNGVAAFESVIAPDDSPVVRNLRNAGAIIIGRTNTPEFSMRATTDNPLHGRTQNPWHPDASPGGSSGGAGSAAAAGFGPIHHGNDIGGSLRFPSSACGVSTVKPGLGRVPAYNPSAPAERGLLAQLMSVQGAICREVKDVRLATEIMARHDPRDPWWTPAPFFGEALETPIKVGLTKDSHGYPIHDDILEGLDRAAEYLKDAGYVVEEIETPSILEPAKGWFSVAVSENKTTLDPMVREHGSETIQKIFDWFYDMSELLDGDGYTLGVADRSRMVRDWHVQLNDYPLILTPFLMRPLYSWNYDAEGYDNMKDLFDSAIYSFGINYLSLPAGNISMGLINDLPFGIQLVGRRFREDLILNALEAIEERTGIMAHQLWDRM